ncbi:hypothetical protein L2E82_11309 [Cichorium intybus]|uniref:Uncharacterized protein n=1 Tax=Cichorium intybus TaxID=13427 RepID=A0ACB9GE00_CICIN|nr:hypothetical protein L2E82_11309 [Cichorium intybus]
MKQAPSPLPHIVEAKDAKNPKLKAVANLEFTVEEKEKKKGLLLISSMILIPAVPSHQLYCYRLSLAWRKAIRCLWVAVHFSLIPVHYILDKGEIRLKFLRIF